MKGSKESTQSQGRSGVNALVQVGKGTLRRWDSKNQSFFHGPLAQMGDHKETAVRAEALREARFHLAAQV